MKFTVADLLDQLDSTEPLPLTRLEKALGASGKSDKRDLRIGLDALARLSIVAESEEGVLRQGTPDLIPARLRCSSKGFCFALREDGGEDIYIRDQQLNHAWNGDRVLVRITREGGRRRSAEGCVLCILERNTSRLLASVEQREERLVAVPLDDRLHTLVELPEQDAVHLEACRSGEAVVEVGIDHYPVAQFATRGHVVRSLPVNGGEPGDLELLLTKHQLHERPAAPRVSLKAPDKGRREDLTALPTLLLQPWQGSDAPGLPALSLEERQEGGWRLWVHAPAVAERLPLGGSLDLWSRQRAEAICVGAGWLPLLSAPLAKAASFAPGDRRRGGARALPLLPQPDPSRRPRRRRRPGGSGGAETPLPHPARPPQATQGAAVPAGGPRRPRGAAAAAASPGGVDRP
jgi:ribonuclease R